MKEAERHHVLPIDDRFLGAAHPSMGRRPDLMEALHRSRFAEALTGMMENVFINVKNKSKTITAEGRSAGQRRERGNHRGRGGRFGGWALYVQDGGSLAYDYNYPRLARYSVAGNRTKTRSRQGHDQVRFCL